MANVQPDIFVRVAKELAKAFTKTHLSGNEWQVLWHVINQTYGWNKCVDAISLTNFEKATCLNRQAVIEAIKKLVGKNILEVVGKKGLVIEYKLQKDFDLWKNNRLERLASREKGTGRYLGTRVVGKKGLEVVGKKGHTIESIKDNIQKTITPLPPTQVVAKATGDEQELLYWTSIVGTTLRSKLDENIAAARRLKAELGNERLQVVLLTLRAIIADPHSGMHLKMTNNYIRLEKNLEDVETMIQAYSERVLFDNNLNRKKVVSI